MHAEPDTKVQEDLLDWKRGSAAQIYCRKSFSDIEPFEW